MLNNGGPISETAQFAAFIGDYIGVNGANVRQAAWMDSRNLIPGSNEAAPQTDE
jgi:hypothetical protein